MANVVRIGCSKLLIQIQLKWQINIVLQVGKYAKR